MPITIPLPVIHACDHQARTWSPARRPTCPYLHETVWAVTWLALICTPGPGARSELRIWCWPETMKLAPVASLIPRSRDRENRRSEEHTSELQSLMRHSYAVFCLKKKNKPTATTITIN